LVSEPLRLCLFTSTSVIGGTERMALEFIRHCDRRRIAPHLMTLLSGGPLIEEASRLGSPALLLDWRGRIDFRAMVRFREYIHKHRITMLHNFGLRGELVARLLAPRSVTHMVSGIRDTDPWRRWPHVWADRLTAGRINLFIANSEVARQATIARERFRPDRLITIHNGIELERIDKASPATLPHAGVRIACLANLKPEKKGHDILFAAIRRLLPSQPGLRVECIGRDLSGGAIPASAADLVAVGAVAFHGYVADVAPILRACDMAVLPSRYESFPASLLEAMAARLPIVATTVGGIPEMITDGTEGLLVPPDDVDALARAIGRLAANWALRHAMGAAARSRVERQFTIGHMVRRLEDVYTALAEGRAVT
jgi:glycosyltransferase involved in cell wall biosynthesis